jgi:hypothetical protein
MQYQTMAPTNTTDRVCVPLTECFDLSEFVYTPATATTDRECMRYFTNQTVVLRIFNETEVGFDSYQSNFTNAIEDMIPGTSAFILSVKDANNTFRRRSGDEPSLDISFVVVNASTGAPYLGEQTIMSLQQFNTTTCGSVTCLEAMLGLTVVSLEVKSSPATNPTLPPGESPTVKSLSDQAVAALISIADLWIELIQPKPIPQDIVDNFFQSQYNDTVEFDTSAAQSEGLEYGRPFMAMVALALIMAVFFPLFMCFVCCCRCCRCCCCNACCGGRNLQFEAQPTYRFFLILLTALVAVLAILAAGGIIGGDLQLTKGKDRIEAGAYSVVANVVNYKNTTLEQVFSVVVL